MRTLKLKYKIKLNPMKRLSNKFCKKIVLTKVNGKTLNFLISINSDKMNKQIHKNKNMKVFYR
jgi:hypothetical protein